MNPLIVRVYQVASWCVARLLTVQGSADAVPQRVRSNPTQQHALRELIISGLTNLLSANMEAGLKHCLPMGYNDDPRTRRIFVHTFARVLQQGTSLVAINSIEDNDRYSRLCEVWAKSEVAKQEILTDAILFN